MNAAPVGWSIWQDRFTAMRRIRATDSEVQSALAELAAKHPEFGFRKMFLMLRRLGHIWNHKWVYRIYCQLKLNLKRKHKRRIPVRNPLPLAVPAGVNQVWSADFMQDALWDGRRCAHFQRD